METFLLTPWYVLPAASLLLLLLLLLAWLWKLLVVMWWKPLSIQKAFRAQGLRGPSYRFLYGNLREFVAITNVARSAPMPHTSHDILPRILPHHVEWSKKYGQPYLYWLGNKARIALTNPDLFREIVSSKSGHYKKSEGRPDINDLFGNGLVVLEGEKWAQHRRILNPAFFIDNLKGMISTMAACAASMLQDWQSQVEKDEFHRKEIDVHKDFTNLTADIIAHTAFGSSYAEGKQVFEMQYQQQLMFANGGNFLYIPGLRLLPTASNRYRWKLIKQVNTLLQKIIEDHMDCTKMGRAGAYGNDLLGLMLAANRKELQGNQKNLSMSIPEIIDECKTFFFAGHETTSALLTWTIMLLAMHSEWQEQARKEVLEFIGEDKPDAESLNHLKIVGMVLNESLRLYPPAPAVFRQTCKDMQLGDLNVPEGTVLILPMMAMHHDPELWGPDVKEFNPQRFADGVQKACKHPLAFSPFSVGPRNCIGQNFSLIEAKVVLAMILQRFTFHLSPAYKHAPTTVLTLQPQYGMQIILEKRS